MANIYDLPVDERKAAFFKLLEEIPDEDKSDEMVERRLKILREFRSGYKEERDLI